VASPLTPPPASSRAPLVILGGGLLIGLLAGLAVFVGGPALPNLLAAPTSGGPTATPAPAPVVGAPAPDFTLNDLEGNAVTLSDLQGQVVILNFWATWCGPCRLEMPLLQAAYVAHKEQGLVILAIDLDDPVADVQDYTDSLGLTFPVLLDPGVTIADLYRVRGWPTSYFVNRDGFIDNQRVGALSEGMLTEYLNQVGLGE